jgi:hypothetical protein
MVTTTDPTVHRPTGSVSDAERGDQLLLWAAYLFTAAVVIHNSDHVRRGADAIGRDVFWVGTAGIVVEVGIVVLVCMRHRLAPLAAVAVGWSLAPAYVLVHFLPERGWLSDSFTSGVDVSPMSWFAASFEVVAALVLGVAGWFVLRQRGGIASASRTHAAQQSLRAGLLHPAALTMLVANAAIVAISFAQL